MLTRMWFLIAISVGGMLCFQASAAQSVGGTEWKLRMQAMLGDVLTLVPYAFDTGQAPPAAESKVVEKSIRSLIKQSGELKNHASRISQSKESKIDPSFAFIAESFESELKMALNASESSDQLARPRAQGYMRSALAKCMFCHTQSANGPEIKMNPFGAIFSKLSSSDRFMALTATRQFDEALKEFSAYVNAAKIKAPEHSQFDQNVRSAIAISVRVKKDAKSALAVIGEVAASGFGSPMLQSDLKSWKNAVVTWQSEKSPATMTEQDLFSQAKRLVDQQKKKENSTDIVANTNIEMLRASSYLHDLLSSYPKNQRRAQSYLLLASVYKSLPGFAIWDLAEEYLGACIRENPHSEIGEKCYSEYDDSMLTGYSGSSGLHLPKAVKDHLSQMKALAKRTESPQAK